MGVMGPAPPPGTPQAPANGPLPHPETGQPPLTRVPPPDPSPPGETPRFRADPGAPPDPCPPRETPRCRPPGGGAGLGLLPLIVRDKMNCFSLLKPRVSEALSGIWFSLVARTK